MESESVEFLHGKNESSMKTEVADSVQPELDAKHDKEENPTSLEGITKFNIVDSIGAENVASGVNPVDMDVHGEFNMEASITPDDVMRAGGFGARDDIGCFLPVASDSTDFEASLRDARDYEDPQEVIGRPGLGWTEVGKQE